MERDDCDLRTEYGLMDERPVVNGIRGEEVTAMRSSSRIDAEDICKGGRPRGTALVHWSRPRCPRACTTAPTRLYLETVDDLPRRSLPNPVQIRMTLTNAKEGECTSSSKV